MLQQRFFKGVPALLVLGVIFFAGSAHGQSPGATPAPSQASTGANTGTAKAMSRSDQNMMKDMARANLAEIEAGKLALSQSNSDRVKAFAQKMIDDHTGAQTELQQLAQAKGVQLPTEPDSKHKTMAKKLSGLKGDKFDKEYLAKGGVADHHDTHNLMERAQMKASDADLKALATKMAPTIDQHLAMAKETVSAANASKGTTSGAGPGASGSVSSGAPKQ